MALLVILLPARPRAPATAAAVGPAWAWALSPDGVHVSRHGHDAPARMPTADTVVAVLAPMDTAWHRITCPKAPAGRLRAALGGLLEERLLDDDEATHLALAPGYAANQSCWVAAMHKPWLQAQLAALAAGGRAVDKLVPTLAPGGEASALFFTAADAQAPLAAEGPVGAEVWLAMADAEQALCLPLAGTQVQALLARWRSVGAGFQATPAAAAQAERALGGSVPVRSEVEQALAAARSPWQLLQFDLAPSRRGTRALGSLAQQLRSPAWRPVRWGLVALSVVNVLGLNAYAWQMQRGLQERKSAMEALLKSTHPQVRSVLDVPVQMRRETELLREAAGVPGDRDFETLLGAVAQAWPDGQAPTAELRYESGQLSLAAVGWPEQNLAQMRSRLQSAGWSVAQADGRLSVQPRGDARSAPGAQAAPAR